MSAFSNSSSSSAVATEDDILASAMAVLNINGHPVSLLPELSDTEGWTEIKTDYKMTLVQVRALKKYIQSQQQPSPAKAKPNGVEDDFSFLPASGLNDCLQLTPDVSVLESLVGPGNCLLNILEPPTRIAVEALIESTVATHRHILVAQALKPNIDIELLLAIRLYTLQDPIPIFDYVNSVLNSPQRAGLSNVAPFMKLLIKGLYAMDDCGYGVTAQASRGVNVKPGSALETKYNQCDSVFAPQQLITFAGFTSGTTEASQVKNFGANFFFHGIDISSISAFPQEKELVVIPPAVFRVGGAFKVDGRLTVPLTHVEQETTSYLSRTNVNAVSNQVCVSRVSVLDRFELPGCLQVLATHYNGAALGKIDDCNKLREYADTVPLAAAMVAVIFHNSSAPLVPNDARQAGKHDSASWAWLIDEANRGCMYAQLFLGQFYRFGIVVDKDAAEALRWFRLAADQGYALAQCVVGWCYYLGAGTAKDETEAVRWYQLSAQQGIAAAQHNLGSCYRDGKGVAQNLAEAVRYLRLSADQGEASGLGGLTYCYEKGLGVNKDEKEAFRLCQLSTQKGNATGQYNVGACFRLGRGVDKNLSEAVRYYRLAADQGYMDAQYELGCRYEAGGGVTKDSNEAKRWFRLAAAQGHIDAQRRISK
jgi:TPR repeat protein